MMKSIEENRERILYGPIGRTLLWLGLPLMLVQLVNVSYNIVDAYWLSWYSDIAYAVPRQVMPTFMLVTSVAQGLMAANLALITQLIGARNYSEVKKYISYFISSTLLVNTILASAYYVLRPLIFRYIVATPPELYSDVLDYSGIIAFDMVLSAVTLTYSTILQSIGDTRTPALINLAAATANVILDPLFILGYGILPAMGAAGAAVATVLSRLVGVVLLVYRLSKKYPYLKSRLTLHLDREWVVSSVKIGAPVSLMMASNSFAFMLQNNLINQFGAYVAAAAAIGFILMDLADATLWGFIGSISVMVGQALGAGLKERARRVASRSILYVGLSTTAGSLLALVLEDSFITLFTSNPIVVAEADRFVSIFLPTLTFFAIFFVGMGVGRGSGHTLYPTVLGIIRLWLLRIALGFLLAFHAGLGSMGVWIAMSLSNLIAGLATIPWVLYGGWTTPVVKTKEVEIPLRKTALIKRE